MSLNNLSSAIIGVLIGLLLLAIGPMVECDNLAGSAMTLQCPDGVPVSSVWPTLSVLVAGIGIASWLYRNRSK
ncbi:hypothetical protein LHL20_14330 [Alteromonas sp. McT4-15]|uniref:hypothetical protein n=1 Tax=unclassified Alteromonas TaxID=2614992 RepID=UPI00135AEDCB|nr:MULTISPECIES: hypothetical protein [unclassified Alteromonas]MCB4437407.1 hypothetical protein [Alteromonas sp. McT4-15]BCO18277.1 hypothetical protein KUC3_11340 [Alteromonas sp. KC3]BCO22237.1 hypothetical protein KUC14_11060 [Alteromonas sp. KC14]